MQNRVKNQRQDWEDLAQVDPCWAILSDPKKRFGAWDLQEFFRTGEVEFHDVMQHAARFHYPAERSRALDFGCGLGRVTRAMTAHFDECVGVDISETMVAKAMELNADHPECKFLVLESDDLRIFPNDSFDLIYSNIVLQHLPTERLIESTISEFVRLLKPRGFGSFQLLSYVPLKYRLQPTRRLYQFFRTLGFSHQFLYKRLKLTPIRQNFLPESRVLGLLNGLGGLPLETQRTTVPNVSVQSSVYLFSK